MAAIGAALEALGYLELPEDQTPPEEIWHSPERIKEWFSSVRQRMKDQAKGIESIEPDEDSEPDFFDPDVAKLRK